MTEVEDKKEYHVHLVFTEHEWRASEFDWTVQDEPITPMFDPCRVITGGSEYGLRFPGTVKFEIQEKTITAYDQGYEAGLAAGKSVGLEEGYGKGYADGYDEAEEVYQ